MIRSNDLYSLSIFFCRFNLFRNYKDKYNSTSMSLSVCDPLIVFQSAYAFSPPFFYFPATWRPTIRGSHHNLHNPLSPTAFPPTGAASTLQPWRSCLRISHASAARRRKAEQYKPYQHNSRHLSPSAQLHTPNPPSTSHLPPLDASCHSLLAGAGHPTLTSNTHSPHLQLTNRRNITWSPHWT